MIGFNGTYLPAASHGNMRITAASIGGQLVMSWLMTATQQAIIAAFGAEEGIAVITKTNDYLNAIALTDTTRAQQLANFINEDPLLVCSLVETSKTRWLVGDGKAYVDTGFIANNYTTSYMYRVVWYTEQSSGGSIIGTISNNAGFGQIYMAGSISNLWGGVGNTNTGLNSSLELGAKYDDTVIVNISNGTITRTTNGVTKSTTLNVSVRPTTSAFLYAYNTGTAAKQNTKCSIAMCLLYGDDQPIREMYPFIRNGENGMLDIISLTFHPNANTQGSFTIALTDKTPA